MTEKQYAKIGSIVVSLAFIIFIIWGYFVYYVTQTATITGIYYREIEGEIGEKWDMYLSFDSSNENNFTYTYYYVQKAEGFPQIYAKIKGEYAGHKINRMIATLCYDPVDNHYLFLPMFYKPYDIVLFEGEYSEWDDWNSDLTPADIGVTTDGIKDVFLFNDDTLRMADLEFKKVSELPSEYQLQFSLMDY